MSAPARSAALKIDWARITASLGLKGNTAASLVAFKKRNEDARRKVATLQDSPQEIDFAHYRPILKNQDVVKEIEAAYAAFKPQAIDISKTLDAITKFESAAVQNAEATKGEVDAEIEALQKTLANIQEAREFDELTVEDVAKARPDIDARTEQMVQKGRWMPPGYQEKFGNLSVL